MWIGRSRYSDPRRSASPRTDGPRSIVSDTTTAAASSAMIIAQA